MGEDERPPWPPRPDLSSDEALDRLLRRVGPLLRWQDYEDTGAPEEGDPQPDPAFERHLRARLMAGEDTGAPEEGDPQPDPAFERHLRARLMAGEDTAPARGPRRSVRGRALLWVGLAAAALAVMILAAVAVVEVGVIAAITTALALVAVAVVLVVRARLGQ